MEALQQWGTDTYYPLGLQLLNANAQQRISDHDLELCLLYMSRISSGGWWWVCLPSNLNRIFSAVTGSIPQTSVKDWLYQSLSAPTRAWPDRAAVIAAAESRPFMFSGQPHQRTLVLKRISEFLENRSAKGIRGSSYGGSRAAPCNAAHPEPSMASSCVTRSGECNRRSGASRSHLGECAACPQGIETPSKWLC